MSPSLPIQHFCPTLAFKSLSLFGPFCIFFLTTASCSRLSLYCSCLLSPLTPSGLFNGILTVSKLGPLNCSTFLCLIPLTLSAFSVLQSKRIHSQSGILFLMPHTLAATSLFSSRRDYPSLNFLPLRIA